MLDFVTLVGANKRYLLGTVLFAGSRLRYCRNSDYCPPLQKLRLIRLITYLIVGHTANLIGGLRYLFGLENGKWQRLAR